ncbi:hypothetical protein MPF19_07045 [Polaribacter sp. Z014]|uniref:hypothetical protein n=1 Tax=Polaribacter sp. Z014 TaxID=2927126 RepID=UPI00202278C1|nr:hypothetical protein [Polaribacter sp. Z014]MCL7763171.1 hypothetical protein [Polaribacter sp. Z014]
MNCIKTYDTDLLSKLPHLKLHPNYLPHIGLKYNEARAKTFIIAESHYLPKKHNNLFSTDDWYNNPISIYKIIGDDKAWFDTRGVIKHYKEQQGKKLPKGFGIFNNLEKANEEIGSEIKLFEECVYLNYFQRPSEVEGDSINIHEIDSKTALENLIVLSEVLKPNKIIFVSSKAYNDFMNHASKEQKEKLPYVGSVPHPSASSWWNRKSKKYGINGTSVTGKEKFQRIMTPKI